MGMKGYFIRKINVIYWGECLVLNYGFNIVVE